MTPMDEPGEMALALAHAIAVAVLADPAPEYWVNRMTTEMMDAASRVVVECLINGLQNEEDETND